MTKQPTDIGIRAFREGDFPAIRELSIAEGWSTPRLRPEETLAAWRRSAPALVAEHDGQVVAFLRGLTDGAVTMYVAELLVARDWRGRGFGSALLAAAHALHPSTRIDLLATDASELFYDAAGFRRFTGYRR